MAKGPDIFSQNFFEGEVNENPPEVLEPIPGDSQGRLTDSKGNIYDIHGNFLPDAKRDGEIDPYELQAFNLLKREHPDLAYDDPLVKVQGNALRAAAAKRREERERAMRENGN